VLCLTIAAARTGGSGSPWRREPGDRGRLLLAVVLLFCALPWIAAGWDLSLPLPGLRSLFLLDQLRSQPGVPGVHQAVHAGFHHGWAGVMLALTALLLSRALPYLSRTRLRQALALYLSFLLAYGLAEAAPRWRATGTPNGSKTSFHRWWRVRRADRQSISAEGTDARQSSPRPRHGASRSTARIALCDHNTDAGPTRPFPATPAGSHQGRKGELPLVVTLTPSSASATRAKIVTSGTAPSAPAR